MSDGTVRKGFVRKIYRQDIIDKAPARWALQYGRGRYGDDKDIITERLAALEKPISEDAVDRIIGNDTWTRLECDGCGSDKPPHITRIGEEPAYEARWVDLCDNCMSAIFPAPDPALSMLREAREIIVNFRQLCSDFGVETQSTFIDRIAAILSGAPAHDPKVAALVEAAKAVVEDYSIGRMDALRAAIQAIEGEGK